MKITYKTIVESVARHSGVSIENIMVRCRKREYAQVRQCAMYLSYCLMPAATITDIGTFFNRNHTTVVHAKKTCVDLMYLPEVAALITAVTEELQPGTSTNFNQTEIKKLKSRISNQNKKIKRLKEKNATILKQLNQNKKAS